MKTRIAMLFVLFVFLLAGSVFAQNQYFLPQVANGNFGGVSFRTTFILFNNTDANVVALLNLTDDNGNPLTVTIGGFGTGSQFSINLDAGSTGFLQTDGSGNGAVGAATVTANASIGVSSIFTVYDAQGNYMTEAGVGSSDPVTGFVLPVDVTGPFNTGLALYNSGSGNAEITAILVGTDGKEVSRTSKSLNAGGHLAIFTAGPGQLFPSLSNFQGTLAVQSSVPLAALVLRQYQSTTQTSYTSLPAVSRSSPKLTQNLAQVANGSYGTITFKTSFLIFNISSSPANVTLALTKDNGSPFTVTITGSGPGTGTNSSFSFTLAAGASVFLQTDGLGAGTSGAATITSSVPVGASAVFTVLNPQGQFQTEAGVGDSPVLTSFTLPVDITGSFDTGIAFYNPGSSTLTLSLKLLDANGIFVNSTFQTLAARNHLALFVDQLFPGTTGIRGSLAATSTGGVASTTLRQYASGATYTTLPTSSGTATGKTQAVVLLSKTDTGISAIAGDPEVALSETLADGSLVQGAISGAGQGLQVLADDGAGNVYSSTVNPLTGNYLIVVPAGTYHLTACYQPSPAPNTSRVIVTYSDPNPVQVTVGGEVRDINLPPASLLDVSGTVSGLDRLPSAGSASIVFSSNDNRMQGAFTLDRSGSYQGLLPAGNYVASVTSGLLQLWNLGSLTVGGGPATGNYAIPPAATLSGTLRSTGLAGLTSTPAVTAADTSAPQVTPYSCHVPPSASSAIPDAAGHYQMALVQHRNYAVDANVAFDPGANQTGTIRYPINSNVVGMEGNATLDISIPALRRNVNIFGNVKATSGNAIADVVVTAFSQSLSGAPNVGFSISGKTDSIGNFTLFVPGGSNYQLTFVPPAPKP